MGTSRRATMLVSEMSVHTVCSASGGNEDAPSPASIPPGSEEARELAREGIPAGPPHPIGLPGQVRIACARFIDRVWHTATYVHLSVAGEGFWQVDHPCRNQENNECRRLRNTI